MVIINTASSINIVLWVARKGTRPGLLMMVCAMVNPMKKNIIRCTSCRPEGKPGRIMLLGYNPNSNISSNCGRLIRNSTNGAASRTACTM